jgi:hypothetical protein
MEIPTKFTLLGSQYTVELDENLRDTDGVEAWHSYRQKKIKLHSPGAGHTVDAVGHAFFHELTHAILCQMNESDINNNEKFVDIFGGLLHQAMKTAEYRGITIKVTGDIPAGAI